MPAALERGPDRPFFSETPFPTTRTRCDQIMILLENLQYLFNVPSHNGLG
jgi:hypothetical protein